MVMLIAYFVIHCCMTKQIIWFSIFYLLIFTYLNSFFPDFKICVAAVGLSFEPGKHSINDKFFACSLGALAFLLTSSFEGLTVGSTPGTPKLRYLKLMSNPGIN